MGEIRRASDGRRLFDAEFKREQIERVMRGGITLFFVRRPLPSLDSRPPTKRKGGLPKKSPLTPCIPTSYVMRPEEFGREADGGSRSDRTSIPNLLIRSQIVGGLRYDKM